MSKVVCPSSNRSNISFQGTPRKTPLGASGGEMLLASLARLRSCDIVWLAPGRRFQDQDTLHGLTFQGQRSPFQPIAKLIAIVR